MKNIRDWNDMQQFGIDVLTGEACVVGLRILCDLTAEGVKLVRHVFGLPDMDWQMENQTRTLDQIGEEVLGDTAKRIRNGVRQFDRNCNSGDKDHPHVASIMLPRCLFTDLAIMACLANGCEVVGVREDGGTIMGIEPGDVERFKLEIDGDPLGRLRKFYGIKRFYGKLKGQRAIGLNAVAAWTGMCAGHNG